MADKLTLHHLEYSQSFRILWLLEHLGVEYELVSYLRDPQTLLAPADYKKISPLGTAPTITHGGQSLAESSAILDYIADLYPDCELRPAPNSTHRTRYLFWMHSAQGSLMPVLLMDTVLRITAQRVPFFLRPMAKIINGALSTGFIQPRVAAILTQAENDLAQQPFFGGAQLSLADFLIIYNIEGCYTRGLLADYPNITEWRDRMRAMPSFQAAMQKDDRPSMILPLA